uniref:Integrase core domain-containing protein n=1 Tax=Strigamia maritima TaxID=126957 RepID=T1IZD9_STRMM
MGFTQKKIIGELRCKHSFHLSVRHLRRILKTLQLTGRSQYSELKDLVLFIQDEINQSGQCHGYKWMHKKCITHGLVVKQEDTHLGLSCGHVVVYEGGDILTKFLWHVDGYDKLKPFGICISGCIDGFSRKVLWLKPYYTNNDPYIIAGYFLETVVALHGCPKIVRQTGNQCYIKGTSTSNQRIEAWWGILRKENGNFWIEFFHAMKDNGTFSGSVLDKNLIQFCFMHIIENELNEVVKIWNVHRISSSRKALMPIGKPIVLYDLRYHICTILLTIYVCPNECKACLQYIVTRSECMCSLQVVWDLCNILITENNWSIPCDCYEAKILYLNLRNLILEEIQ